MRAHRKGFAIYFLTSIAIVFSLLLISVFLFSKIYLAKMVQDLVADISREKGYEVKIGDVAFGFLSGFEARKIEIFDSSDLHVHRLKIGELIVRPDITSSIIKRRLEIQYIVVNEADLSLPKIGFEKLKRLSAEISQKGLGEEEEKFLAVGIRRIELNMAEIEVSNGVKLYINKFDFRLTDHESRDQRKIDLNGTLILMENEIGIDGSIKTSSNGTSGKFYVNVAELKLGSLSNVLENRTNPSVHAELDFRMSETLSSSGKIRLENGEESGNIRAPVSTELRYEVAYDKKSDTLLINTFDFELDDWLRANFDGTIDSITTERVFNINGAASTSRLEDVITMFHGFSRAVAKGKIEAKDLKLTGSFEKDGVTFSGGAVLSGVDFYDNERDIRVSKLRGTLDFKKIISQSVSSGLSINGRLNSDNIETKIGVLEDLDAGLEFKTSRSWDSSELSFSLDDLKVNTRLNDTIKISNVKTTEPIIISFKNNSERLSSVGEGQSRADMISIMSRGIAFENASLKGYSIQKGAINDFRILYGTRGEFYIDIGGSGSGLGDRHEKIFIDGILLSLSSSSSSEFGLRGDIRLQDGRYGGFEFSSFTSDYILENGEIKLINLVARLEGLGELNAKNTMVILGTNKDGFSSKIEFSRGSFSGPRYGIESKGMGGQFIFYDGRNKKTNWDGNLFVDELRIKSQAAEKISLKLDSSSDGIRVDDLEGRVFGGRLAGSLLLNTSKPHSFIASSFIVEDASIHYRTNNLFLERMVFDFRGTLDKGLIPQGNGELRIENLRIMDNKKAPGIRSSFKFQTFDETLVLKEGFIDNGDGRKIEFAGRMEDLLSEQRVLEINSTRIPLGVVGNIFSPFLPESVRVGELTGDVRLNMVFNRALDKNVLWSGKLSIENTSFSGVISGVPIYVNGVNGVVAFDEYSDSPSILAPLLREHRMLDKKVFERFLSLLNAADHNRKNNFFTIDEIRYGFLSLNEIECLINVTGLRLNLNRCASNLFDGRIYVAGSFAYGVNEDMYSLSVLFKEISLEDISNRVNSIKDYITGRINGLVWLNGKAEDIESIDGLFKLWSIKSRKESRRLGKAFLEKLGAKSRFFVGSSRRYDRGEISGYIKDGVLTFSEFDISNSIFGYKNLSIKVDARRNTISIAHMLSVIREISRRAGEGQLQIDLGNKRN